MAVLTPLPAPPVDAPAPAADRPSASGPVCSLQRSGSLWQLGIEAQELTTAIGQLAEQLAADDPEQRASALAELEAALLAEEGNKKAPSSSPAAAGASTEGAEAPCMWGSGGAAGAPSRSSNSCFDGHDHRRSCRQRGQHHPPRSSSTQPEAAIAPGADPLD